jgi:hypothetical protein
MTELFELNSRYLQLFSARFRQARFTGGGAHVGRPRALTEHHIALARDLLASRKETRAGVAAAFAVDVKWP